MLAAALPPPGSLSSSNELLSRRVTVSRRHGAGRTPRSGCGLAGAAGGCPRLRGRAGLERPGQAWPGPARPGRGAPEAPGAAGETAGAEPARGSVVVTWRGHVAGESGPAAAAPVAVRDGAGRAGRERGGGGAGGEGEARRAGAGAGREPGGASGRRSLRRRAPPR